MRIVNYAPGKIAPAEEPRIIRRIGQHTRVDFGYKTPGVWQTPGVFMTQLHDGVNFRLLEEMVVECKA